MPDYMPHENQPQVGLLNEHVTTAVIKPPTLIGTPKQVAWAEDIREKALRSRFNDLPKNLTDEHAIQEAKQKGIPTNDAIALYRQCYETIVAAREKLLTETRARWWIDNKGIASGYVGIYAKRALNDLKEEIARIKTGLS